MSKVDVTPSPNGVGTTHAPGPTADRACVQCQYDLRMIPVSSVCPECGLAVAVTMSKPLLRYLGSARLGRLQAGLTCISVGLVSGAAIGALCLFVAFGISGVGEAASLLFFAAAIPYCIGWFMLKNALRGAAAADGRLTRVRLDRTLLLTAWGGAATPLLVGAAILAGMGAFGDGPADEAIPALLLLTSLSSGTHLWFMPAVTYQVAQLIEGIPTRKGAATFRVITRIFHGVCMVWTVLISILMLADSNKGFDSPGIALGLPYLFTLPVHGAWLIWACIHVVRLRLAINREAAVCRTLSATSAPKVSAPPATASSTS